MPNNEPIKVLIVDDRPENLTALEALLGDMGFLLVRALSGNEALRLTLRHTFALVLLDVQMPDMDGFETAELLRSNPKTRNLPIMFITAGMKDLNYQFKGYDIGAVDYLAKPIEPHVLRSKVRVFCDLHAQRLEIERREEALEELVRQRTETLVQTAESLLESRERYRSAFEQAAVGIAHVSTEGTILQANPAYCTMLRFERSELEGKSLQDITCSDMIIEDLGNMDLMREGKLFAYTVEQRCFRKDGTQAWLRNTVSLARDKEGRPEYFIRVAEDFTENQVLREQLLQSQKMEAVGLLAGGIAHDFNNILSVIMGYGNMISMKAGRDPQIEGYLNSLIGATEKAAALTRGLLAFSRKQEITLQVADLNDLVIRVSKLLERIVPEDISFDVRTCEGRLAVNIDAGQIEQVMMNLVTNARDAMPQGGALNVTTELVTLDANFVSAHGFGAPGDYAMVCVADTGEGINREVMKRIFDPFFTTKEIGHGTGLGLSIVYGIVSRHNGYVKVFSEPGVGTSFRVYLPLYANKIDDKPSAVAVPPRGGSETILLAEDDELIRVMETQVLADYGYKVIAACNGQEVLQIYREQGDSIALLLLDVIMPVMNGSDAYEEIRKIKPDVKALFITGYTADLVENKGLSLGDVGMVMKPVLPQELARRVRQALDS